jgi:hypothetical protein
MANPEKTSTLYVRNVPAALVREAKVKAAREGTTLGAVVIDALQRSMLEGAPTASPDGHELDDDMRWYQAHRAELFERYQGRYVAIADGAVIDDDLDFDRLATRVFARMGTKPIFMPRVLEGEEKAQVRSPRRRVS